MLKRWFRRPDAVRLRVLMICTGGTTGRPKGVMWRQADTYTISMNGADHQSAAEIHAKLGTPGPPWFAVSPLMHAAGMWTAFAGVLNGQTVVLYDSTKFDPDRVLSTAQRHKVGMMTMVGDAYAAPLVAALRDGSYDLSSLYALATGGAATNPRHQRALLEMLPNIILINGYGSSETGNVGFGRSMRDDHKDTFELREGALVLADDYSRFLGPGEEQVGWVARAGRIPLGYFDDAEATRVTFPEVDGQRVVISGDRGSLAADGTLRTDFCDPIGHRQVKGDYVESWQPHPMSAVALERSRDIARRDIQVRRELSGMRAIRAVFLAPGVCRTYRLPLRLDESVRVGEGFSLKPLLPLFDHLLTTLVSDLVERGRLDDVLIIAMGEFGRTPIMGTQGSSDGRNHWPNIMSMCMAGGGLQHGQVIGASERDGGTIRSRPVKPADLAATLYKYFGVPLDTQYIDHRGRPRNVVENGEPISELIGNS